MEKLKVHLLNPNKRAVTKAVEVLDSSGVVLLPGDTSYLLAVKIGDKKALEKLNLIKKNRGKKFYSVALSDLSQVSTYADLSDKHYTFIKRLVPGPYTFLVKASKNIPRVMLEKRKEIGLRIPDSALIAAIIEELGRPLIVSTARSTEDEDFFTDPDLDGEDKFSWLARVDLLLDGGYVLPELTTIIALSGDEYEVIRVGKGDVSRLP